MFNIYKIKIRPNWSIIRAHIWTVAVAFCFNSSWRVPRDAFRYGGVVYGLVFTVFMIAVALPITLLQLSVGQLSQQDPVGIWRTVPFFSGVGYLRLLITFLASIYTVTYLGISTTFFFYSINNNSVPFWNCWNASTTQESNDTKVNDSDVYNISTCVNGTILMPVHEQPEYYMAMALITLVYWVLFPLILYNPVRVMKKIVYGALCVVLILAVTVLACLADGDGMEFIYDQDAWTQLGHAEIWYRSMIQALWSAQTAGGYLIVIGGTAYSCIDVQWTTMIFISVNILASWFGLIFWYAIGGTNDMDASVLAVLVNTYKLYEEKNLTAIWPLVVIAFLLSSGVITVITLLYPLFERFKRIGGHKWRYLAAASAIVGAGGALAALAAGLTALSVLDDTVVPFLISITTILEICPLILIYGWRRLLEDIEFLVGREVSKYWSWWWCAAVGVVLSFTTWWLVSNFLDSHWMESMWTVSGLVAAAGASLAILLVFATITVARQVQYDLIGKLKSSFTPSRHWGPRDPITHYYWLARRNNADGDQPHSRYHRRQLGQFSGNSSFLNINNNPMTTKDEPSEIKRRSNSDDWLYTYRKQHFAEMYQEHKLGNKKRSKSLDWADVLKSQASNNDYR